MGKRFLVGAGMLILACVLGASPGWGQSVDDGVMLLQRASQLYQRARSPQDLIRAARKYEDAMRVFDRLGVEGGVASAAASLGIISAELGQHARAIQYFEKALPTWRKQRDAERERMVVRILGQSYAAIGKYDKAVWCFRRSLKLSRDPRLEKDRTAVLIDLGLAYAALQQTERGIESIKRALALSRKHNQRLMEIRALHHLGNVNMLAKRNREAVAYMERALRRARKLPDPKIRAGILSSLGDALQAMGKPAEAVARYQEVLVLWRNLHIGKLEARALKQLGSAYAQAGHTDQAEDHYKQAIHLYKRLHDIRGQEQTLEQLGRLYARLQLPGKALECSLARLAIVRELGEPRRLAHTLLMVGALHIESSGYAPARKYCEEALNLIRRNGLGGAAEAGALICLGDACMRTGRYANAVKYYEESLLLGKGFASQDIGKFQVHNNMGLAYMYWGNFPKAISCYAKALDLAHERLSAKELAAVLNNIGLTLAYVGEYAKAVRYLKDALAHDSRSGNLQGECDTWTNLGDVYRQWGQYAKSKECYETSLEMADLFPNPDALGNALFGRGKLYAELGLYPRALEDLQKSLAIRKKLGDLFKVSVTITGVGTVHRQLNDNKTALKRFKEALAICEKMGLHTRELRNLIAGAYLDLGNIEQAQAFIEASGAGYTNVLARLQLVKGDYRAAKEAYEKLLKIAKHNRDSNKLFTAYTGLGLVCEGMKDDDQAIEYLRKAVEHTEDLRSLLNPAQRERFFSVRTGAFRRIKAHEALARVLLKTGKASDSLAISEHTKARAFAEALSKRSGEFSGRIPEHVLKIDRELNHELGALIVRWQEAHEAENEEIIRTLEPRLAKLKEKHASHLKILRTRFPLFAATKYPEPMTLKQTGIRKYEWCLAYEVTDAGICIWLLNGKRIISSVFKPIQREDLDRLIRSFREPLEMEQITRDGLLKFRNALPLGRQLFDILVRDVIQAVPEGQTLIVVPDDILGILPFEMLVIKEGSGWNTRVKRPYPEGVVYFGDRNPLSYYQSLTALSLARIHLERKVLPDRSLVMADPVFGREDARLKKMAVARRHELLDSLPDKLQAPIKRQTGMTFARLPLTGELAKSLKDLNPDKTDVYVGMEACKARLFKTPLGRYRSIVFATHGYVGEGLQGIREPVLFLTLVDQPKGQDGYLRMSEVMSLDLNAGVVALTACQTGLGKEVRGEGTLGMGRAFQYAGAKSVLMSLWSVSEISTATMAEKFFSYSRQGRNKLEALQLARKDIRAQGFEHPFYWAPFILVGEVD